MIKPVALIILDGWGLAPPGPGNAIALAKTPNMDRLWAGFPRAKLKTSGKSVGLPEGEMGNSEVGHLILGAGRVIYQDFSRISLAISNGSFSKNKAFIQACQQVKTKNSRLHLLGLLSFGGVHADRSHLYSLLQLAKKQGLAKEKVKLHLFTDGRDSAPKSALSLIEELKKVLLEIGVGEIASLTGRYFAMDRDRRWERTKIAYEALVLTKGQKAESAEKAIDNYYQQNITDEFIPATNITGDKIEDNDAVIFYNFRTDRARQLTRAFVDPEFYYFARAKQPRVFFVTMTEFEKDLPVDAVAFLPRHINDTFPRVISEKGLRQLHVAETEKYAFVTYYFNGLYEDALPGEKRILIPSAKVSTYDLKPEMSANEITEAVLKKLKINLYSFILVNFANPDMVGHTGVLTAGIKACEVVDECVGKITRAVLLKNGVCLIVADHGNVEEMIDLKTGEVSTKHSLNPVPLIIASQAWQGKARTLPGNTLADVSPTILKIMGINKPEAMTGRSLI